MIRIPLAPHPDAQAWHRRGAMALQGGDPRLAAQALLQAIRIDPRVALYHAHLADALALQGQAEAALVHYDAALRLDGTLADVHYNRGNTLYRLGRFEEAGAAYALALAHGNTDASTHGNRGLALLGAGRREEALQELDLAVALRPDHAAAYCNRGNCLRALQRVAEALDSYDTAIRLQPGLAAAWSNRSAALRDLVRLDEALQSCEQAIRLAPGYADAHANRGLVLKDLGRWPEALAQYERALALDPAQADAWSNRGVLLQDLQQVDAALASFGRALQLRPAFTEARFNRSLALLLAGRYEAAWPDYEWRWRSPSSPLCRDARPFASPQWSGAEELAGRTVLLHAEQGLGDALQFCRYVPQVAARGARVILEVQTPLAPLLASLDGVAEVVSRGATLPPFDYHCPLMSLPLAFGTTLNTIPAQVPYLRAEAVREREWRERLGPARRLRVGLVWAGGSKPELAAFAQFNARRDVALAKLAPLRRARVDFFSLQKGAAAEQELASLQAAGWDGPAITALGPQLHDFAETAAAVAQLDLVISVDTSTAHLAAAMGRPVWLLNRFDTCWRWLLGRDDSPWYPTLRLYRQARPGDWDGVIERICVDLVALGGPAA
jgi:tetratricopeptide (TPR) repeat protein